MKYTQWEGGVRGNGFVWSPRLQTSQYTCTELMQIEDLFPTLLHSAGYNTSSLPPYLYGKDMWNTLSKHEAGVRQEVLHNIDPRTNTKALRIGDMKLIMAGKNSNTRTLDSWYKPEDILRLTPAVHERNIDPLSGQVPLKGEFTDYLFHDNADKIDLTGTEPSANQTFLKRGQSQGGVVWNILRELGRTSVIRDPVLVQCGPKPTNASTNCQVSISSCLYNITADPCEYHNLAAQYPNIVQTLTKRLQYYESGAAPIRNKPNDPKGSPSEHNGMWVPWVNLGE